MQSIADYTYSCNITTSLTRLKSVFVTFDGEGSGAAGPGNPPYTGEEIIKTFDDF